jgi:hypothetical protein
MKRLALLFFLVLFAMLVLVECTAKITGSLQVDGQTFAVTQCRSGQAFGFSGVEFTDAGGRRLRLPDGTCAAALFSGNGATGDRLGQCGVLTMAAQSSRINSIVNLQGTAKLDCEAVGHKISGNVEFENCH